MKFLRLVQAIVLAVTVAACSALTNAPNASALISIATPSVAPTTAVTAVPAVTTSTTCTYLRSRGPNCSSRVILTYDDCPNSYAAFKSMVLAAKKLNVALVLFPTGECIQKKRFNATYARAHGHYVFNHSVTHRSLTTLSYRRILQELSAPGIVTNYGRPPYGAYNATVQKAYAAKHMRIWTWSVDTNDWQRKSRASVVAYVIKHSSKGQTVLMHMQWNAFNATALKQMKSGLANRGLKVCRNYPGTTPIKLTGNLRC